MMMTMGDNKGSDFRNMVVSMLTGFAGSKNVISIPHVFFKWTKRNHPLAIFFSQALYWHGKTDHPEKWFARTLEEWDEETGLGRAQLERAAVILEQVGLQREVKRSMWHGFVPVVHYRFDEEKLFEAARAFFQDGTTLSMKSTKESREKLKEDNALRSEKRKGHLNVESKPRLNATSKRQSNFTSKREMNAANDSYIKTSRDQEENTEKITTSAATHQSAVISTPANQWPDNQPVDHYVIGNESSARADNSAKRLQNATATTPPPSPTPSAPAPEMVNMPPALTVADGTETGKKARKVNEGYELGIALGDAWGIPPAKSEINLYIKQAKALALDVPVEEFKMFCDWRKADAGDWAKNLTIKTLLGSGHVSKYLQERDALKEKARKQKEAEERLYAQNPHLIPSNAPVEYASKEELQAIMSRVLMPRQENVS